MVFQLTAKNCQISDLSHKIIDRYLDKMTRMLSIIASDLVMVKFVIRKNKEKTYSDSKPALAYFEGSISFRLNKNRFYVHFKGQTINECANLGFNRILSELKKYKQLHFSSESKYPDHKSIRDSSLFSHS